MAAIETPNEFGQLRPRRLRQFEKIVGKALPDDYREFMLTTNGGTPVPGCWHVGPTKDRPGFGWTPLSVSIRLFFSVTAAPTWASLADRFDAPGVLFPDFLASFDILDAVEEFGRDRLWGPDLVAPTDLTYISPWVLGGDPCVDGTRIQTASVFTLRTERGLSTDDVLSLYPDLDRDRVDDAYGLERRLRGIDELTPA